MIRRLPVPGSSPDYLIAVDDISIIGMQLSEAVEKLRGEVGSKVTIKVQRGQLEPFDLTIIRDFIKIRSVRSEIFDGIGYVRLTTFSEQTTPGLIKRSTISSAKRVTR